MLGPLPNEPETPSPLAVEVLRGAWVENCHPGWFAVVQADGRVTAASDGARSQRVFLRSAAKPFQYLAICAIAREAGRPLDLSPPEIALACGSHGGSPAHLEVAHQILARGGLTPEALRCGPAAPMDAAALDAFIASGASRQPLYHNCSGKHAAMLLASVCRNWSITAYDSPEHPLQQAIQRALTGWAQADLEMAIDGCGAPTFRLSLAAGARLFAWLAVEPEAQPVREAMTTYPEMVSGVGRFDAAIARVSGGAILSKTGADGVLGAANLKTAEGFLLKIADGSAQAREFAAVRLFEAMGWLRAAQCEEALLRPFGARVRRNSRDDVIGAYRLQGEIGQPPQG